MSAWTATTPRGRVVLAAGAVLVGAGLPLRYPVLAALGVVLVALVVVEVVAVLQRPQVQVHRSVVPLVVLRHEPCTGRLRITGPLGRLVRVEAEEHVGGRAMPSVEVDPASGEAAYDIATARRGLLAVGPLLLTRTSLCGTAATTVEAGGRVDLTVLPRRVPLTTLPSGRRRSPTGTGESLELGGTDLTGLHEYTVGDDLRRVHWATTARTGTLMVREDADPAQPHVCVLLDDHASSYTGPDDFEEAVEVAAALCRVAIEAGDPVRLRTSSGRHDVLVPASAAQRPPLEARDVEWLLAEVHVQPTDDVRALPDRGHDVVVLVTGAVADLTARAAGLPGATDTTLCVVDPEARAATGALGTSLVLRAARSDALARLWDEARR